MDRLLSTLRISVPKSVYLKDPESSDLGKRIIEQSIRLIDEMGIETFTFKNLEKPQVQTRVRSTDTLKTSTSYLYT